MAKKGRPLKPVAGYSTDQWTNMTPAQRSAARKHIRYHAKKILRPKPIPKPRPVKPMEGYTVDEWRSMSEKERCRYRKKHYRKTCPAWPRHLSMITSTVNRNKRRAAANRPLLPPVAIMYRELEAWLPLQTEFVVTQEWKFPMTLDNGRYCSLSMDRLDNERGYSWDNVVARPWCLNSPYAFSREQLANSRAKLLDTSVEPRQHWAKHLSKAFKHFDQNQVKVKNPELDLTTFRWFLRELFVRQGGRCAYTGFPMFVDRQDVDDVDRPYIVSVERLNPRLPYSTHNVALICRGVQFGVHGGHIHGQPCDEDYLMQNGVWNQDYWNNAMRIDDDVARQLELVRRDATTFLTPYLLQALGP